MDYHEFMQSLSKSESKKNSSPKDAKSVTFNMRVNETLRNQFHKLCDDNHTTMSREVKRFMRLAVENQKL